MSADTIETPVNPSNPAIIDTTRKTSAHLRRVMVISSKTMRPQRNHAVIVPLTHWTSIETSSCSGISPQASQPQPDIQRFQTDEALSWVEGFPRNKRPSKP